MMREAQSSYPVAFALILAGLVAPFSASASDWGGSYYGDYAARDYYTVPEDHYSRYSAPVAAPLPVQTESIPQSANALPGAVNNSGGTVVGQVNQSDLDAINAGNNLWNSGAYATGAISATSLANNSGITTVLQNTGDLVNMNYSTSVNVFMQ